MSNRKVFLMINFKKMTQIKEDDKYKKVDIKIIQLLERLQVGARSLFYLMETIYCFKDF